MFASWCAQLDISTCHTCAVIQFDPMVVPKIHIACGNQGETSKLDTDVHEVIKLGIIEMH